MELQFRSTWLFRNATQYTAPNRKPSNVSVENRKQNQFLQFVLSVHVLC